MKKVNLLSRAEMKKVIGGHIDDETIGSPGGDNGNPCGNNGYQAAGGTMVAQYGNGNNSRLGNCNDYPYDSTCHNGCVMPSGANFWC